ncbi:MAG: tetratricopeptide repeat protein [Terriglobales bacterium]
MLRSSLRYVSAGLVCAAVAISAAAQQPTSKATLDASESVFSTLAAIGHCGYAGNSGDELRRDVLQELAKAVEASDEAKADSREMCQFYLDHRQADSARDLAQYVSLALNMGAPPSFDLKMAEADLPPDANYVLGFRPLLTKFAQAANLHEIWTEHQYEYNQLIQRYHDPVTNMLLATDLYLRVPMSGYLGRAFVIYLEPMAGQGLVNARNYGADYYMVVSPQNNVLAMDSIRHTYLHFMIDPMLGKRGTALKRLQPLLPVIATAPLDENYKHDTGLLVSESLIRAIEARLTGKGPAADPGREKMVEQDMAEGFILTRYFYGELVKFEKDNNGFQDALADFLYEMDVDQLKKRAQQQVFTTRATPEVVAKAPPGPLQLAEQRFDAGDYEAARELALQALKANSGDQGRVLFLLGQVASLMKDMPGAVDYFGRAAQTSKDPHVIAWSHIYLGRIADIKQERETAVAHYNAALLAGDPQPQTKAAAERGLKQAYAPPVNRKQSE